MNENQEASPASQSLTSPIMEAQSGNDFADIVLFCHPDNVSSLVMLFEEQVKHAAGALPVVALWSGQSRRGLGVIVLEWQGEVTPAFLHTLAQDPEIFDYVCYDWVKPLRQQENQDRDARAERGQESAESKGGTLPGSTDGWDETRGSHSGVRERNQNDVP